jgi:hypothetical protein
MAVLSTMHIHNIVRAHQSQRTLANHDDHHVPNSIEIPSTLFGAWDEPTYLGSPKYDDEQAVDRFMSGDWHNHLDAFNPNVLMRPTNIHGQPRTRGKKNLVWHCSECREGPYGTWQNVCTNCSHKRCSSCEVEEAV